MDIPNLSQKPLISPTPSPQFAFKPILIISIIAVVCGYVLHLVFPKSGSNILNTSDNNSQPHLSTDTISGPSQLKIGQLYGDNSAAFKDSATGVIQKGGINGVGTHTLVRDGGPSQSASLTSSTVDLDLFTGKKVEVKGETNASAKTAWLMDVGSIKILE